MFPYNVLMCCGIISAEGIDFRITPMISEEIPFMKTQMSENVYVTIRTDDVGEGDEVIVLQLDTNVASNVINVGSINSETEITIIEDDCEYFVHCYNT